MKVRVRGEIDLVSSGAVAGQSCLAVTDMAGLLTHTVTSH